jgi:hypothetical protein
MVDKSAVGKKLFDLRKKKGITQDYLARQVNVTPPGNLKMGEWSDFARYGVIAGTGRTFPCQC